VPVRRRSGQEIAGAGNHSNALAGHTCVEACLARFLESLPKVE
jgi:hypothetical protein